MANKSLSFYANDAFAYVKTYDSLRPKSLEQIRALKDRFEKQFWEGGSNDEFYNVKMRAFEDSILNKLEGVEPDLVSLDKDGSSLNEYQDQIEAMEDKISKLERTIQQQIKEIAELQSGQESLGDNLTQKDVIIKELRRRIANNHEVFRISGVVLAMISFFILYMVIWR
ncbi:MAG: hypothetical protein HQL49_03290 [Gammaproteobacteria bacterium]|nr:hypothetical protein [Gammaproteobacteria bacterium]